VHKNTPREYFESYKTPLFSVKFKLIEHTPCILIDGRICLGIALTVFYSHCVALLLRVLTPLTVAARIVM